MIIDVEEVVRQLTIMKKNGEISPSISCFEDTIGELDRGNLADPCTKSYVDCQGMPCNECIFETTFPNNNLPKTLQILEDNPDIIIVVGLLG
jgi:hypothetical protein